MPTKKCPYCQEEIAEEAKVCKFCSSAVVKKCPFCSEEIGVLAKKCRHCGSDLATAAPGVAAAPIAASAGPLGENRDVLLPLLLIFVTCGIYWFVWMYQMGQELNRHAGRELVNPGLDILLSFLTCGIWVIVMCYKYGKALYEVQVAEGIQGAADQSSTYLLLGLFLSLIVPMLLQGELNRHWELHRTGR